MWNSQDLKLSLFLLLGIFMDLCCLMQGVSGLKKATGEIAQCITVKVNPAWVSAGFHILFLWS